MRYSPDHKAESVSKIVKQAGVVAKKQGFGTTGIDTLVKAAGLTTGAFYKHFSSKDALLTALVENEFSRTDKLFFSDDSGADTALQQLVERYLTMAHVANPEKGCMLPSLSSEVARASQTTKEAFNLGVESIQGNLAQTLTPEDAWAALSMAVGAITLARACSNETTQKAILDGAASKLSQMACKAQKVANIKANNP